ncbi:MAG TPA: response regulator [Puia sp.]|jgi:CheY-like chemotaxis protein|nr:response regulator [Puia sp.]
MTPLNKVLLVDDDRSMNFLSQEILKFMNAAKEILVAEDGLAACQLLDQQKCPDLIFLDIRMPRMDGFGFLERMERSGRCKNVRVVMLSSSVRKEDKEKALSYSHVVEYCEKPLTEELIAKIADTYF